jgi:predicted O-methyltransferase YrrM
MRNSGPRRTPEEISDAELFDLIAERVGHDSQRPGWTPALVELHRYSLRKRLVIIPEHFYTPVYAPDSLPDSVWRGTFEAGTRYDADEQIVFLEQVHRFPEELEALDVEASAPESELARFYWRNTEFSHGDAVLYYSMLRHLRPRRVIEVGGGYSTLLASAAAEKNGTTEITCIEPYPRPFLKKKISRVTLLESLAQEVAPEFFDVLEENDVLFIDSSHVSKTGSDVNHLYLRVLPRLKSGVWVHLHDIFLPFEYPRSWVEQQLYWNEQYLLAALLSHSAKWSVVVANNFLVRTALDRIYRFSLPSRGVAPGGSSFWIRATG